MEELVGRSPHVRRLRREALEAASARKPVVLLGPGGSFLVSLAVAVHLWSERRKRPCLVLGSESVRPPVGSSAVREVQDSVESVEGRGEARRAFRPDLDKAVRGGTRVILEAENLVDGSLIALSHEPGQVLVSFHGPEPAGSGFLERCRQLDLPVVTVAPLRQRREDLPALIEHMSAGGSSGGATRPSVSDEALQVLEDHVWPGNLEELQHVLGSLRGKPGPLARSDVVAALGRARRAIPVDRTSRRWAGSLPSRIQALERREILRALETTGWNRRRSAAMLGLSRRTLGRRMDKLGIISSAAS